MVVAVAIAIAIVAVALRASMTVRVAVIVSRVLERRAVRIVRPIRQRVADADSAAEQDEHGERSRGDPHPRAPEEPRLVGRRRCGRDGVACGTSGSAPRGVVGMLSASPCSDRQLPWPHGSGRTPRRLQESVVPSRFISAASFACDPRPSSSGCTLPFAAGCCDARSSTPAQGQLGQRAKLGAEVVMRLTQIAQHADDLDRAADFYTVLLESRADREVRPTRTAVLRSRRRPAAPGSQRAVIADLPARRQRPRHARAARRTRRRHLAAARDLPARGRPPRTRRARRMAGVHQGLRGQHRRADRVPASVAARSPHGLGTASVERWMPSSIPFALRDVCARGELGS